MHRILNSQFLYNPDGRVSFCHAPSIAETASGTLVAAWYAYEEEECREAVLVIAHKPSGEESTCPAMYARSTSIVPVKCSPADMCPFR